MAALALILFSSAPKGSVELRSTVQAEARTHLGSPKDSFNQCQFSWLARTSRTRLRSSASIAWQFRDLLFRVGDPVFIGLSESNLPDVIEVYPDSFRHAGAPAIYRQGHKPHVQRGRSGGLTSAGCTSGVQQSSWYR
jgi:hypothetical protein